MLIKMNVELDFKYLAYCFESLLYYETHLASLQVCKFKHNKTIYLYMLLSLELPYLIQWLD